MYRATFEDVEGRDVRPLPRDQALLMHVVSIRVATSLSGLRFYRSYNNFAPELFFSSDPVVDILPRLAAPLHKQLVSSVSDNFFG